MNLENKKQMATIIFAGGLGLITALLTSQYVKSSIEEQTKILAEDYQKKSATVVQEMDMVKREIVNIAQRQQQIDQQQQSLQTLQQQIQEVKQQAIQAAQAAAQRQAIPQANQTEEFDPMQQQVPVFSLRTPRGKRAVTVLIDALSAVGGLINPGDFVDVIAKLTIPKGFRADGDKELVTTMLFQNLQVLAVNTQFEPMETRALYAEQQLSRELNVTLALDPEEAGLLSFAQTNGKLQMALRSPSERGTEELDVASWETLADYVMDVQGTKIDIPTRKSSVDITAGKSEEARPFVQVFRGGLEL